MPPDAGGAASAASAPGWSLFPHLPLLAFREKVARGRVGSSGFARANRLHDGNRNFRDLIGGDISGQAVAACDRMRADLVLWQLHAAAFVRRNLVRAFGGTNERQFAARRHLYVVAAKALGHPPEEGDHRDDRHAADD